MTKREKTLGTVVVLVISSLSWQRVSRFQREEEATLRSQLLVVRDRVEASRALMATAPKVEEHDRRPAALNDTTMRMLRDLTIPPEIQEVKVENVEHPTPAEYRVSLSGEFKGIMRYLSYLERPDGDFRVNHVQMGRIVPTAPKEGEEFATPPRRVHGLFTLTRRG